MFLLHNLFFITPKIIRLNSKHYFIFKISNNQELWQIAFNHSPDIDVQHFVNLYKKCTTKPYSILVTDDTLASDNPLRLRKNVLEKL